MEKTFLKESQGKLFQITQQLLDKGIYHPLTKKWAVKHLLTKTWKIFRILQKNGSLGSKTSSGSSKLKKNCQKESFQPSKVLRTHPHERKPDFPQVGWSCRVISYKSYLAYVTAFLQTHLSLVYHFFCERKAVSVQWRQLVSCDWSWHSHWSLIPGKFDLKINRSMKNPCR